MARLGLMVNPTSGKNTGAQVGQQALSLLRDAGVDVLDLSASDARSAVEQGRAAIGSGAIDRLVVGGGDGMVHLGANLCAGTPVSLGVIAAGTGNDIARELGLPVRDAAASVQRILSGSTRQVDAARHTTATGGQKWFLGVLAAGFDAVVNERANQLTWPKGPMRYNLAILRELPVFRAIPYTLVLDGERIDTEAMLVAVGNGASYGGGMRICPAAVPDDGMLDVTWLSAVSKPLFLRVFPTVFRGRHVDHPAVRTFRGRSLAIAAAGQVAYADGERLGALPVRIETRPGALRVLSG